MYDYGEGGGSSSAMDNLEENRRRQQEEACGAKNSDVERDEYGFELVDLCPDAPGRAFMPQMGLQLYSERDGSIKLFLL